MKLQGTDWKPPMNTANPDQSARIAELSKQVEVMREALIEAIGYIAPYTVSPMVVESWKKLIALTKE